MLDDARAVYICKLKGFSCGDAYGRGYLPALTEVSCKFLAGSLGCHSAFSFFTLEVFGRNGARFKMLKLRKVHIITSAMNLYIVAYQSEFVLNEK